MRLILGLFGLVALALGALFIVLGIIMYFSGEGIGPAAIAVIIGGVFVVFGKRWLLGTGRSGSWKNDPATERQKEFADDLGIKYHRNITKGELSAKITEVTGR